MDGATDDVNQATAGELQLMDPRVRASRQRAGELLDPEFVEVGGSGRRLTYEAMLGERRTRHSSIWRKQDQGAGWRMYYHQATRVPPGVD
jgi:hypothetical protein